MPTSHRSPLSLSDAPVLEIPEAPVPSRALRLLATTSLIACASLLLLGCKEEAAAPLPPRPVLTQQIGSAGETQVLNYAAEVRSRYESPLAFRVAGKVLERKVELGSRVAAGQVLARLDPVDLAAQASAAKAQVEAARTDMENARRELTRYQSLRQQNFVSAAVLEQKQNAFDAAQARFEAAKAQATVAGNQSAYTELRADQAGVVSQLQLEPGQVVNPGQVVLKLSRDDSMEVAINVPENQLDAVRKASDFAITLWNDEQRRYRGALRELAQVADPATRSYAARIRFDEPVADARLGMTAKVFISGLPAAKTQSAAIFTVPSSAIFQQDKTPALWVVGKDNTVQLKPVQIVRISEQGTTVSGLQGGERIVTAGVHKLIANETVTIMEAKNAPFGLGGAK